MCGRCPAEWCKSGQAFCRPTAKDGLALPRYVAYQLRNPLNCRFLAKIVDAILRHMWNFHGEPEKTPIFPH